MIFRMSKMNMISVLPAEAERYIVSKKIATNLPLRSSLCSTVRSPHEKAEEGRLCVTVNNSVARINYPSVKPFNFPSI